MNYFQLGIYQLDTSGGASIGGMTVGSWTTNAANQIIVTLADASTVAFDVSWLFNDKNQLTVQSQNTEIFNFSATGLRNSFTTRDTALLVKPSLFGTFQFALAGEWEMDPDHNLTFTAGGIASTLTGFVSDPLGRLIFHFADQDNLLETNVLGFAGSWQSKVDANGTPLLDFYYQTLNGRKVFELPAAVAVNRNSNQLTYTYSKDNKNLSIDFQGTLMIGADFKVTYVVQPQVSSGGDEMVASTTLDFGATLTQPNLHGDLELTVTKPDGTAGASTLTVGGQYQGVLGKTNLQIGFTFTQTFGGAGNQITRTAAFSGSLALKDGKIQWTFGATGTTIELAVGVDIKLGGVQLDAQLNLPMDAGASAGVTFLLGVSF